LVPDVYAAGAKLSGLVEPAQSRLQMWDWIWLSSSLPYSGAKITAWGEMPSRTLAEATQFTRALNTKMHRHDVKLHQVDRVYCRPVN
jgi:hypothetical protein